MVIDVVPFQDRVVGPLPFMAMNMAYKWGVILTTYPSLPDTSSPGVWKPGVTSPGMILQVGLSACALRFATGLQ